MRRLANSTLAVLATFAAGLSAAVPVGLLCGPWWGAAAGGFLMAACFQAEREEGHL
jgi:hypothetical protein